MVKWIVRHFFRRKVVCCSLEPSSRPRTCWSLLVSDGKFGFFRPDLDGNKPAKGKRLARKVRNKGVFSCTEDRQFFIYNLSLPAGQC